MARAGRRARQRARALAARRLTQQRAEQRARERGASPGDRLAYLWSVMDVFNGWMKPPTRPRAPVEWSSDDSSCDVQPLDDEQALSPTAVFHEYFYAANFERLVKFLQHSPIGLTLLESKLAAGWDLATSDRTISD